MDLNTEKSDFGEKIYKPKWRILLKKSQKLYKHNFFTKDWCFWVDEWKTNNNQFMYTCRKRILKPRLLKIGENWVFFKNTSLPQIASKSTADDVKTSQVSNQ